MRNYKTAEELVEIERACNVTADMHITAMKVLRIGMKEWEVVAALEAVAQANGCGFRFLLLPRYADRLCITIIMGIR